jgi:hypothetical protein
MKQIIALISLALIGISLVACNSAAAVSADPIPAFETVVMTGDEIYNADEASTVTPIPVVVEYDEDDLDTGVNDSGVSTIRLEGDAAIVTGGGATVDGSIVTITSAGTFEISGTLNDGRIIVDTQDQETVVLLLDGVDITSRSSAPITINSAEKAVITLAAGSENHVTDAADYVFDDPAEEEPNAAIFSKDDLTINGDGSLVVEGNFNHGIASKDDLKITGGTITVSAVNDGIKGRDSIAVRNGVLNNNAGGDGMQSNNDVDAEKGIISIEGGTLDITAGLDGIQAETSLLVSGGEITLVTGGGSGANYDYGDSAKGLKAGLALTVTGGVLAIDAADDALHSDGDIIIDNGQIVLATADDGLHAEAELEINGGELTIIESYEGLEGKNITINGGTIHLDSSDDGINGSTGGGDQAMGGRPGPGQFMSGDSQLTINGGYVSVDAWGDGLDINGAITMTGGVVLVNGPVENNNGPVDYMGAFDISGGFLVASGSAGMAQAPTDSSDSQYSVMVNFDSAQAAGTIVHIQDQNGSEVLTFAPTKQFQSLLLSSPALENGVTYTVYAGGSVTGTENDSLYVDGIYTPGTEVATFTISSAVTLAGSANTGFFGGGPGGPRPQRP